MDRESSSPMETDASREPFNAFHDQRGEERRRTGFLEDKGTQRQRTQTFYEYDRDRPVTYRPGFNPPRRPQTLKTSPQLPIEISSMIVEEIKDPRHRIATRGVDRLHSRLTRSVGEVVRDTVRSQLKDIGFEKDTVSEDEEDRYRFTDLVTNTYSSVFEQLSLPLAAFSLVGENSYDENFFGDVVVIHHGKRLYTIPNPNSDELKGRDVYEHEFHVNYWGKRTMIYVDDEKTPDAGLWNNYPVLREITLQMERFIKYMQPMSTRQADIHYLAFTNPKRDKYLK